MPDDLHAQIEEMVREARADPRSTDELISSALSEQDEDRAWEAVSLLHLRGTRDVFDAASSLCRSDCIYEKTLGANILGQIGVPKRNFPRQSLPILHSILERETDLNLICSTCTALGHIGEDESIPHLARFADHRDHVIRLDVAMALGGFNDELAIATLITLSSDTDGDVRDWSFCALGSMIETDTPAIREALFRGTADSDEDARGEALVGLARRKDERVVEPILRELAKGRDELNRFAIEAAEEIGVSRLLPALMRLKNDSGDSEDCFDRAIQACSVATIST